MAHYFHHAPGRLRIKFAQLRNNPSLAQEIEVALRAMQEVMRAEVCIRTGSLLVRYRQSNKTEEHIFAAIFELNRKMPGEPGPAANNRGSAKPLSVAMANQMTEKLVGMVVEKCIERSALALLGILL